MCIRDRGRLSSVSEFEDIVVRANPDGSIIRLKDVARISLEASSYNTESGINGGNAAVLNINMLPGANAMEVAALYHKFYQNCRVKCEDSAVCAARAALCRATATVLENTLAMLKITAPEVM